MAQWRKHGSDDAPKKRRMTNAISKIEEQEKHNVFFSIDKKGFERLLYNLACISSPLSCSITVYTLILYFVANNSLTLSITLSKVQAKKD